MKDELEKIMSASLIQNKSLSYLINKYALDTIREDYLTAVSERKRNKFLTLDDNRQRAELAEYWFSGKSVEIEELCYSISERLAVIIDTELYAGVPFNEGYFKTLADYLSSRASGTSDCRETYAMFSMYHSILLSRLGYSENQFEEKIKFNLLLNLLD